MIQTLIYGHRGNSILAPENSLKAFQLCAKDNIDGIELDVHICKTGELVVFHDFSIKRMTGIDKLIEETDYSTLKTLNIGEGEKIPLLDEVFQEFKQSILFDIELKYPTSRGCRELVDKTWNTIKNHSMQNNTSVSSFNPFTLKEFNKVSKKTIDTADIYGNIKAMPFFLRNGAGRFISGSSYSKPKYDMVNEELIKKIGKNRKIVVWTVDDIAIAKKMKSLGVYAIISNNPKLIKEKLF